VPLTEVALAVRAALQLETSAEIRSTTLGRLPGRADQRREGSPLPSREDVVGHEPEKRA